MVSLPLGAVRLQQEFLRDRSSERRKMWSRLHQFIDREVRRELRGSWGKPKVTLVLATSGTAAALAEASECFPEGAVKKLRRRRRVQRRERRARRSS